MFSTHEFKAAMSAAWITVSTVCSLKFPGVVDTDPHNFGAVRTYSISNILTCVIKQNGFSGPLSRKEVDKEHI